MQDIIYRQSGRDGFYRIWHKPEKNMFILIHAGSGSIVTRDASHPMHAGTLCFIGEDKYHYTFPDDTEDYVRSKLFVSTEDLCGLLFALNRAPHLSAHFSAEQIGIVSLDAQNMQLAEQIFCRLGQLSPEGECDQIELYSAILRLIGLFSENGTSTAQGTPSAMQTAIHYINEHITENITIEQVCAKIYMSKYHFCRVFKQKTGVTFMEYILKTRIMMAKELLHASNLSVTEISEACAFSSVSYFSRVFKIETKMTPLQYRKMHAAKKAAPAPSV